jgi:eukaryotic-like serine/threonine-protein kinase
MIGSRLAHYEITRHLGSGGMGDVYQATDTRLGRSVAIKLLPDAFTRDADRVARFEREARVLASLNHSNIAAIHGLEESGERKFLVMEQPAGKWQVSTGGGTEPRWRADFLQPVEEASTSPITLLLNWRP